MSDTTQKPIEVIIFPRWVVFPGWTQIAPSWWVKQ